MMEGRGMVLNVGVACDESPLGEYADAALITTPHTGS